MLAQKEIARRISEEGRKILVIENTVYDVSEFINRYDFIGRLNNG